MEFESDEDRLKRAARMLGGETPLKIQSDTEPSPILMTETGRPMSATEMSRSENYQGLTIPKKESILPDLSGISMDGIMDAVKMQKNSAGGIWRNLFGGETDEKTEAMAYEAGNALGIRPQALLDDPDLMRGAVTAYQGQKTKAFLQGKPFTPQTLASLYPELNTDDPVAASMALRHYNDVLGSRETINLYSHSFGGLLGFMVKSYLAKEIVEDDTWNLFVNQNGWTQALEAGKRDYDASMIIARNMDGTLSDAETAEQLKPLVEANSRYEQIYGKNDLFVGATLRNLSNMYRTTMSGAKQIIGQFGPQGVNMLRELMKYAAPAGAVLGGTMAAAGAAGAGIPLAVGSAVSGLGLMAMSTFIGSYKQMAAQNYWTMKNKRDEAGKPLYTREQAIQRARTQAFYQAGLEAVGAEVALYGPVKKVFGENAAAALIRNTAARNAIVSAGRGAIRKEALKTFGKQYALGAGAELAEEGMQQAVADIDETLFGNDPKSGKEILWNAIDAMVQAAPAVLGMVLPGAALRGGAQYSALSSVTRPELHDAVEEYKRENEKEMTVELVKQREKSGLFKKSPEVYAQTIQKQMERSGSDTLYIDAASAAETEQGQAALNELVDKHVVTEQEVTDAVSKGTALEVKPGVYMQAVSEETASTLADHSTFDKGGRTLADIQAARERMKAARAAITETREDREAQAVKAILDRDFQTESAEKDAMREVLADDIYDVKGSLERATDRVKSELAKMTSAQEKIDYIREHRKRSHTSDVGIIDIIGEGGQYESRRVTANDGWYSAFFKEHKKAPTIRDAYDIAYDEAMKEIENSDDPAAKEEGEVLKDLHDRLETLEGLTTYVDRMDKDDMIIHAQMSDDAYREVYTPALSMLTRGNAEVSKAAKDSAFLYAKMAEALHEAYHIPYKDIARIQMGGSAVGYGQMAGINAETAPLLRLAEAKAMEANLASQEEIWKTTGWLKGKDGKWRWEIPDYLERIKLDKLKDGMDIELKDLYNNSKLYQAYPWMRNIQVFAEDIGGDMYGYTQIDKDGDFIVLNSRYLNDDHLKKTLVHEIQHMIQRKEGFASGGTPGTARRQVEAEIKKIEDYLNATPERKAYYELLRKRTAAEEISDDAWWEADEQVEKFAETMPEEEERAVNFNEYILGKLKKIQSSDMTPGNIYFNFAGEKEARYTADRAEADMIYREHYGQSLSAWERTRYKMDEELSKVSPEDKARITAYLNEREERIMSGREETEKEREQRVQKEVEIENYILSGKFSEEMVQAFGDYDLALFDLSAAAAAKRKIREMPEIHNGDAIIVMGGDELPYSEESVYFQEAPEADLIAYHNISEKNIKKAIELGGLPMPSIAVTKKDIPFGEFGDITLIGTMDMVDPKKGNEVYSRDAYTTRFPEMLYKNPKKEMVREFQDKTGSFFDKAGEENYKGISSAYLTNYERKETENFLAGTMGMKLRYFSERGKNIRIPMKEKGAEKYYYLFEDRDVLNAFRRTMNREAKPGSDVHKKLSEKAARRMDDLIEAEEKKLEEPGISEFSKVIIRNMADIYREKKNAMFDSDGMIRKDALREMYREARAAKIKVVDQLKLKEMLDKDTEGFHKWLSEEMDKLYGEPLVQIGRKKVPATLSNIVKAMQENAGAGKENSLTFADNKVLAFGARLFSSVDEMHEAEGALAQNQKNDPVYGKFMEDMRIFHDEAERQDRTRGDFSVNDRANAALAGEFKKKNPSEAGLAVELRKNGFRAAKGSALVMRGMNAIKSAREVTTDYFEAKPERAVQFGEFAAAIVPKKTDKEIVDYLKGQGIRVVKYDPDKEGDRQTKTQQTAQKERVYFQENGKKFRGAYDSTQNVIHIFDGGDQSTVIHEGAHFYLSTLERIAASGWATREVIEDIQTIRTWAGFSDKALEEYTGTALEKEFQGYAEAIRNAKTDEERMNAEERFMQERFARGFERYLMTGKAPTKEVRGVFRRFKKWLTEIYKEVTRLGLADPPADVRAVFDKMVGTQEEISSWAAERRLEQTDIGIDFTQTEEENIRRWSEEIKEKAKEKALAYFMARTKEESLKQFEETLKTMREQWKEELVKDNVIYQLETLRPMFTYNDWKGFLAGKGYDEQQFDEAIEKAGGPLEERLDRMVEDGRKQYIESVLSDENIRQMAEEEMAAPEGRTLLADIEAGMLRKRINRYIRTAAASMIQLNRAADVKAISRQIRERNGLLTKDERQQAEIGELKERAADAETEKAELKQQLTNLMDGLKRARDTLNYKKSSIRTHAEWTLSGEPISRSTNWKWWDNKAAAASRRAAQAVRNNDWHGASEEKLNEMHYAMMSRVARENQSNIQKALHGDPRNVNPEDQYGMARYGILGIINRIGRTKNPIRMTNMSRYFVQHMAYQIGLTPRDAVAPVDEKGNPIPFSWQGLARELNPTQAMNVEEAGGVYLGDDIIAGWIKSLFESNERTILTKLTYGQFMDIVDSIKAAYTTGRREYEGNTLRLDGKPISFADAEEKIVKASHPVNIPKFDKLRAGTKERIAKALGKAVDELTLPEIIFERMGPVFYELFYQNIDRHANVERQMEEEASAAMMSNLHMYSRDEWQRMRNDKAFQMYPREPGSLMLTKENVIAVALNWGNKTNRARIKETLSMKDEDVQILLDEYMEDKDWDFVEAVWKHIDSYWPPRNKVQEHLYGVPLGKTKGIKFKTKTGREIQGMYYPIKYDKDTSVRTAELSANEIVQQQMQGVSTFALGMGSTKKRAGSSGGQNVRLDLEVYPEHIAEAVHHIAMREATVDVYKLLTRPGVKDAIVRSVGIDTFNIIRQWAQDQWHSPIDRMTIMERLLNRARRNMTFAAMAFRVSTALLNATNIFPMMDRMGAKQALHAIGKMYLHGDYRKQRAFIMEKSSFMRGRMVNMDRDLVREKKLPVGPFTWKITAKLQGAMDEVNKFGYAMIVETDFALSLPQWMAEYRKARQELEGKEMKPEEMDEEAVRRADKAVRETFGSGEIKDQPAIVKSRILSQFLPFYSYTSLVLNQFIRAGRIKYDKGDIRPLVRAVMFWWLLGSIAEAGIRHAMAEAAGDEKEKFWQRLGASLAGGGPVGGIPIARDVIPFMAADAMGIYRGDGKTEASALAVVDQGLKVYASLTSDKKDWIDTGRDFSRMTNRVVRMSDTLTDGFWSLLRLVSTDTDKTFTEILASLVLDKKIPKKGESK